MKKRNLLPLVLFCLIFLAYSLYFVKVVNHANRLEPNSIAKTIKRALDDKPMHEQNMQQNKEQVQIQAQNHLLAEPIRRYVNYRWLNVRQQPSLASPVVEKIFQDEEVTVLGYPTSSWALIETSKGSKGYVARRYLTDTKPAPVPEKPPIAEVPEPFQPAPEPIVDSPVANTDEAPEVYDVPVITYHHISNQTELYPPSMVLPEPNLFAQLDYLISNGFKTYTFYDLKAIEEGKKQVDEKAVILTFNGGYADAYQASQHLNGKGLKGVFFLPTDKIGTEGYLTWDQVRKMRSWGMEIGSMGVTGANLLTSGDFYIENEVKESKNILEEELGEPVITFAYAKGGFNDKIVKVVQNAGYLFARTSNDGSRYSDEQLYQIPTLRVFFPAGANQFRAWLGQ